MLGKQERDHLSLNGTFPGARTQASCLILFLLFCLIPRCGWDSCFPVSRLQPRASVLWVRAWAPSLCIARQFSHFIVRTFIGGSRVHVSSVTVSDLGTSELRYKGLHCEERQNSSKTILSLLETFLGSLQCPPEIAGADSLPCGGTFIVAKILCHLIERS